MISPATHYGYDENGNCLVQGTAADATNSINPQEVQKAIENLRQVFEEQMNKIAIDLMKITDDADQAVIVEGAKITSSIEDTASVIKNLPNQILADLDMMKEAADVIRDKIQESWNADLYNKIASHSGVVQIK